MKTKTKIDLTSEILAPLTAFCALSSLFIWVSSIPQTSWMRRFFLYMAGLVSLTALVFFIRKLSISRPALYLIVCIMAISTLSLSLSNPVSWGLIGMPISHPALLSLFASIFTSFFFAFYKNNTGTYIVFYYLSVAFIVANLFYWTVRDPGMRLGYLGLQINYTAFIAVLGLIIGFWTIYKKQLHLNATLVCQTLLLVGLFLTQSRVCIVIALVATAIFALAQAKQRQRQRQRQRPVVVLVIFIAGLLAVGILQLTQFNRLHSGNYLGESIVYRANLTSAALPADSSKLILGGGVGSIERNISANGSKYADIKKDLRSGWKFESSHNYLVDVLVERGAVVLALYLVLISMSLAYRFRAKSGSDKLLFYLLIATLVFTFFNNINIQMELIFWCLVIALLPKTSIKLSTVKSTVT